MTYIYFKTYSFFIHSNSIKSIINSNEILLSQFTLFQFGADPNPMGRNVQNHRHGFCNFFLKPHYSIPLVQNSNIIKNTKIQE